MMRNTRFTSRWRTLGALVIAFMIITAAIPLAGASPSAQGGTLRIGYLGPSGTDTANGAQLAIDQINAIGGVTAPDGSIYALELITMDEAPTAETISAAANTLVGEDATVILGPDTNAQITPDTPPRRPLRTDN